MVHSNNCEPSIWKAIVKYYLQRGTGGATARPPRAAGRARRQVHKENFFISK